MSWGDIILARFNAMVDLFVVLHAEGILSEGQVAAVTGLDRVDIRARADEKLGDL